MQWTGAIRHTAVEGIERLRFLVIRYGIASLPVDVLLNCDDLIYAVLAFKA